MPCGKAAHRERWRRLLRRLVLVLAVSAPAAPARAQEPVRVGIGFGLAFLPIFLCEDLKLIEKHGKDAHLNLKVSYQRFPGAGPLQDALASGAIDVAPYGVAPLLTAWEKGKGNPRQIVAVAGLSTLPLTLLTNRAGVRTLADFRPTDRIAVPTASSPQAYLLRMQAEKVFGQYDRLQGQVVTLANPDAVAALVASAANTSGYFASAPFTEVALEDGRIHKVLSSTDIVSGKASFLVLGGTRRYVTTQPKAAEALAKAMDEAASIIHDDPHRAAQIYLTHEPSRTLNAAAVEGILKELKDEFGSAVHGVEAFAAFMGRHGELKSPPTSWKDIVAPALANSPST